MYRRTLAVRWRFAVAVCVALVGIAAISLWRPGGATEFALQAQAAPDAELHAGAALAAESSPAPTLKEILEAVDALAGAGQLPGAATAPMEVSQADALAKAGELPSAAPTPTLKEILQAVNAMAMEGTLPGQPPLAPAAPTTTAAPPQPAPKAPPAATGGSPDANYEARVLELVNAQRAKFGLAAIAIDSRLGRSAGDYAEVLGTLNWFSHTGPDGSTLVSRVEAAGFPFTVPIGEVLAWGNEGWTPEAMVQAWMNSLTHRVEVLSPVYTRAGVGCYSTPENGTTVHCVIDFGG